VKVYVGQLGGFLSGSQGVLVRGVAPLLGPPLNLQGVASGEAALELSLAIAAMPSSGDHAYLQGKLLRHIFGIETWVPPGVFYVGLAMVPPTDDNTGSSVSEPADAAYSRVAVAGPGWSIDSQGRWVNLSNITFPTSGASWGTPQYLVLFDSPIGGNVLKYGKIASPVAIGAGTAHSIASGQPRFQYADSAPVSTSFRRVLGEFVAHRSPIAGRASMSVSLTASAPVAAGDSADLDEPMGSGFARVVTGLGDAWGADGDTIVNAADLIFPEPGSSWGTYDGWAITATPFGGDVIAWGDLEDEIVVEPGTPPEIPSGAITVRLR